MHAHPHTHTRTCPRAYASARTLAARQSRQIILGGLSLQTLSTTWRNVWRCAPFLTDLGTHCIRLPRPNSQRLFASLAAVSVVAVPITCTPSLVQTTSHAT
jgi:hypothetical protein